MSGDWGMNRFLADLRIVYHLLFARATTDDHGARLEAFYSRQADAYDDFRRRLLHGREEMMRTLDIPQGSSLLDIGRGTGSNLEYLVDRWDRIGSATLVDFCPALLRVAEKRASSATGRRNVHTAVRRRDQDHSLPRSTGGRFSRRGDVPYSLTMDPDWFGGSIHAHKAPEAGLRHRRCRLLCLAEVARSPGIFGRTWPVPAFLLALVVQLGQRVSIQRSSPLFAEPF